MAMKRYSTSARFAEAVWTEVIQRELNKNKGTLPEYCQAFDSFHITISEGSKNLIK